MILSSTLPQVITLGCRLNIAESETIRALLAGHDAVVVNSCAVTGAAVKETRAAIRRLRRERPGAELIVTGCAATIDPAGFAGMAEVDRVVANDAKLLPASWGSALPSAPPPRFAGHARALVAVQNGCDHACTFCAIPAGRGASRSVAAGAVVEQIAGLVAAGHREVVLTGVDLTSWGHDLPGTPTRRQILGGLVERVLRLVPALPRLRLSSLDSVEIDPLLFELVTGEPRVAPHLHLSLQAGHDLILKRMKRRHSRAQAVALVERVRARRDVAIGADLIAGFPTEDDAMAAATLALIEDAQIVHAHIFPYSPRTGTPAARMPQVPPPPVVRERAARLRVRAAEAKARWLAGLVGSVQEVLVERPGHRGRAGNFAEVRLTEAGEPGVLKEICIGGATETQLLDSAA